MKKLILSRTQKKEIESILDPEMDAEVVIFNEQVALKLGDNDYLTGEELKKSYEKTPAHQREW